MTSKPRKDDRRTREAHIYMTEGEYNSLQKISKQECRSVNGQILVYIKRGLEQDAG
jgi:hypothetical protein